MKRRIAATFALFISFFPALLLIVAFGNAMGDPPAPRTPEQLRITTIVANAAMAGTLISLVGCGWLSGYGFSEAPTRSILATMIVVASMIVISLVL